jgi:hypothetical protein
MRVPPGGHFRPAILGGAGAGRINPYGRRIQLKKIPSPDPYKNNQNPQIAMAEN